MDEAKLDSLFDLTGRVAIVTGGTRGIGRAVAEGFVAAGASVVVASRKADACLETQLALEAMGGQALGVPTHVGRPDDLEALVAATVERFGQIDIIVNNAANALALPVGEITEIGYTKSFQANLLGPTLLIQHARPYLEKSDHAAVVNVISVGAFLFSRGTAMYASMKSGLLAMSRAMAGEFAERGIRVNCLAPGTVDTDMVRNTGPESAAAMAAASMMKRAAHPDEMVGAVLYMASDAGSFMTGQVMVVDGGMHPY
jgi:NAD(P)-dependent dehydrogenase (short-subunit alcohol dehydrogenase family)